MLTKTDFTNLRNEFATKKDLKKFVTNTEFRYEINRLDKRIDDFHKEFVEFKDTVLQTLDWLVGAFKDFKDELQILTSRYPDIHDRLDNHEIRITKLEKKTN
ncbi:hypothetical protein A3G67_02270 [Candidatus Roizmanbacteria bacterium RIFCSPLOWO2_12_FULL_40_12]|uniref:Uncharacterized protein n=1 Tax=Candidatus Roizmanbacteria bacterium RIFCSPLOWO2_01_FULL_40_42 TaxID=1802066 RepID=A0A1F7J4Y5_9BACT|nr:MAG: hypothetical protein A2779_01530 [Candidatus Roizmanbacteria bacterium RIFCSPHIGHO2_01_FULL_40_98]OGK29040.1 MAG: hypothetical protein A3C31_02170 [Candidatus Roizmanbacteria bacterium RIFCSPHIGHO2_02_FULL_40_53]OGK29974.1 MAG: hypothetical protein A2W49_00095 [Candidatus Roizmanbacteria bacterium RIFCSPHIGHO2_12_41_18]OGK36295.1 MAG: hypothetical protein A3E69_03615 [Candidatus Roizmanbacteria bacterium RIFCSPHIGHO2_12_FULL_40_130]OGK50667.1 MAG: hypothetical protein A3B50_00625 [Candi